MPPTAADDLQPDLVPGERLIWSGRSRGGIEWESWYAIPMMLAWIGISGFMGVGLALERGVLSGALFPLSFILIGLGGLSYFLIIQPIERSRTAFGLTDSRVIISHWLFVRRSKSLLLQDMEKFNIQLKERRNRTGTISFKDFGEACGEDGDDVCYPEIDRLPDAWQVVALIRDAIEKLPETRKRMPMRRLFSDLG